MRYQARHQPDDEYPYDPSWPLPRIIALIPVRNGAKFLAGTVASLRAQTLPPDRIIAIPNNCTDNTAEVARDLGVEVIELTHNAARKAGALNAALARLLPDPSIGNYDFIFCQDDDTRLVPDFFKLAYAMCLADPRVVVSGRYAANHDHNLLGWLQRNEFARDGMLTDRRSSCTHILVGTSAFFRAGILRHVARARAADQLPGPGYVYQETSITEDFELTLAIKTLGYKTMSPKGADAVTEVMHTLPTLWSQRIRWMRGGVEDLHRYGWTRVTRGFHIRRAYIFFGIFSLLLYLGTLIATLVMNGSVEATAGWVILTSVFIVDRVGSVSWEGVRAMLIAAALIPEMVYNLFSQVVYLTAIYKAVRGSSTAWR